MCSSGTRQLPATFEVGDEVIALTLAVVGITNTQQLGRLYGGNQRRAVFTLAPFSAQRGDLHRAAEKTVQGRRAQSDDCCHKLALLIEPPFARGDLPGIRSLVNMPLAALLKFEMPDRIRPEGLIARYAGGRQRFIQHATGRADKWAAGKVFLVARLLANQNEPCLTPGLRLAPLRRDLP